MKSAIVLISALLCICNKNPSSQEPISFVDGIISSCAYDDTLECWNIHYPEHGEVMATAYLRAHQSDGWNDVGVFGLIAGYEIDKNTVLIFDETKKLSLLPFEYRIIFFR